MSRHAASETHPLRAGHPVRTAVWLGGAVCAALLGSALLTVLLLRVSASGPVWLREALAENPVRLMRRLMVLAVLPILPVVIRAAGGARWSDAGWSGSLAHRMDLAWRRDLAVGLAVGIASLGLVVFVSYASGGRIGMPFHFAKAVSMAVPILISATVIGLLEETAIRGFMLGILRRQWAFWPAALVTSLLFAWGHYVEPATSAFEADGIANQVFGALGTSLTHPARVPHFVPRFVNLALMGAVLCLSVRRYGTVWMAVGLHTGWVIVKKLNGRLGNIDRTVSTLPWIGQRSDAIDGWLTAVLLLALGAFFLLAPPRQYDGNLSR